MTVAIKKDRIDFSAVHAAMQAYVDKELLPGFSIAVTVGGERVESHCCGWADREADVALREDHIFRLYSNTKLFTSAAALMLIEDGRLALDDPVARYLPAFADMRVLRPGATGLSDTEPARIPITLRHLLTHTSGLLYDFTDPEHPICRDYVARRVRDPQAPIAQMIERLAQVPLAFQPGTAWDYSFGTDVVGGMIEAVTGRTLGEVLDERIFEPLGLEDTGFHVGEGKADRLVRLYAGADLADPLRPGLTPVTDPIFNEGLHRPRPWQSGGGGLLSTLGDMARFLDAMRPGREGLLKPETVRFVTENLLPAGLCVQFGAFGEWPGQGHSAACGVMVDPAAGEHPASAGECFWSGAAGTQWWFSPAHDFAVAIMTQRQNGAMHPFAAELKRLVYEAVVG